VEIGLIGLGNMGSGIARSLLRAGHKLTVYNRTRSRAEVLEGQGALVAGSIAEACRREAVLTMLADDRALESVVFGEDGILASLPRRGSRLCFEYDQRGAE
jgi:3-hydroxyisobutyrate dehydrogenase-like beta-hydroxyacid dehydrogenase